MKKKNTIKRFIPLIIVGLISCTDLFAEDILPMSVLQEMGDSDEELIQSTQGLPVIVVVPDVKLPHPSEYAGLNPQPEPPSEIIPNISELIPNPADFVGLNPQPEPPSEVIPEIEEIVDLDSLLDVPTGLAPVISVPGLPNIAGYPAQPQIFSSQAQGVSSATSSSFNPASSVSSSISGAVNSFNQK